MSSTIIIDPNQTTPLLRPHPDHLTLNTLGTTKVGIDQIRDLIHWAYRKPFTAQKKQILICQAQNLSEEAQNALLKILEEPPANTQIVLTVDHPENLLTTVRSRCQIKPHPQTSSPKPAQAPTRHKVFVQQLAQLSQLKNDLNNPPKNIRTALNLAKRLSQLNREEALAVLKQFVLHLREEDLAQNWPLIKQIRLCQKQIRANVNLKLALENMLINML